jgi:hypothetical protein
VTLAIGALSVSVIEPAFWAPLVATVGIAALLASAVRTAGDAAVALAAITMRTDPEHRLASLVAANSLPQNYPCASIRPHRRTLTRATIHARVETSFDGSLLMKVAKPEPRCFEQRGSLPPSKPQYNFSLKCFGSDD